MSGNLRTALTLYFLALIYTVETAVPTTLREKSVLKWQAEKALNKIEPGNALPLILFSDFYDKPALPVEIKTAVIIDGRMAHGTKFISAIDYILQRFFCAEKNCIVRKKFENGQLLQCEEEPMPNLESADEGCLADGRKGHLYGSSYKICGSEDFDGKNVLFYNICYDGNEKKSLYSKHIMRSPELLNSKLLIREREVNYEMRDDLKVTSTEVHSNTHDEPGSTSHDDATTKSAYKPQKLVPAEDMALGLWRKTTFEHANVALQHEKFVDFWNEICEHIRYKALLDNKRAEPLIYTGVFDTDLVPKDATDQQMYNIWIKVAYYYSDSSARQESPNPLHGIAVLMNNFIETEPANVTDLSDPNKKTIKTYCDENLCVEFLKNKFQQIGGNICCSPITEKILKLFGLENGAKPRISPILDITKDEETFRGVDNVSYEQAAYSIKKINREEVLPIIFVTTTRSRIHLKVPSSFSIIKTKNRRISSDSQFVDVRNDVQMFFCPRAESNDKCLEPTEFDPSKPLQCTTEATPIVKELPEDLNKCGRDGRGTLQKIVYKICDAEKPYEYETKELELYEFCNDKDKQKILYTHHRIRSTELLFSKLLHRERTVEYPMTEDDVPLSNLQELKNAANSFISGGNRSTQRPPYRLKKLVPSEDMAFSSWRKSTYNYINVELLHEKLIPLWSHINFHIRTYAHGWSIHVITGGRDIEGISILTGVFDIDVRPTNGEKSNIWVKIIYDKEWIRNKKAIAILMTNFVALKLKDDPLKEYCEEDLCAIQLRNLFEEAGGQVRCCSVNTKIAGLFGLQVSDINPDGGTLFIRNIIKPI